ncbi:hypothetical protein CJ195_18375 [Bacillus sp. UMB0899]|nr:hypothetical protein CJ195_18375 [Bacillus sp. UMB0899]
MGEIKIPHNNYDIVFKNITSVFKEGGLKALDIKSEEIDTLIDTEQPIIDIQENQMDMVFRLIDKSFLHLEFQTTNKKTDLSRFLIYDARLYELVRDSVDDNVKIRTVVIYGPKTGNPKSNIEAGSFSYNVEHIYIDKIDGDNVFNHLYQKVETDEPLTDTDKVNLILSPLMGTKEKRENRALQSVELASKLKEDRGYIIGAIIGLTNTIVSKDIQQKMLEVFQMTDAFKQLEEESFKNQRKKDINYLIDQKVPADDSETQAIKQDVSRINSTDILNKLWNFLAVNSPNLDELKKKVSEFLNITKQRL